MTSIATSFHYARQLLEATKAEWDGIICKPNELTSERSARARMLGDWQIMAAREAAFLMYDMKHALEETKRAITEYAALRADTDWAQIKFADLTFKAQFPHWEGIRNAVGHTGERGISVAQRRDHSFPLKEGMSFPVGISRRIVFGTDGAFVSEALDGRTLRVSAFNGEYLGYEITDVSEDRLWKIIGAVIESMNENTASETPQNRAVARAILVREMAGV